MLRKAFAELGFSAVLAVGRSSRLAELTAPFSIQRFATSSSDATSADGKAQIWVGNLPFRALARDIRERFAPYGAGRVYILRDKETKNSRGMALIVVDADKCEKAIAENNGTDFLGRMLRVNMSTIPVPKERPPRPAVDELGSAPTAGSAATGAAPATADASPLSTPKTGAGTPQKDKPLETAANKLTGEPVLAPAEKQQPPAAAAAASTSNA
ncbi:hypothetical protein VaNZ11_001621 [Volvox africanus]|uniref:RRM domain-containing protein n=1 Tax=Volvox africanus TaxID=51714 RepID=A0ABQ5RQI4_9CHLO|nr:hypothetical protein VaNZ11_001621 [Volvox africanus]